MRRRDRRRRPASSPESRRWPIGSRRHEAGLPGESLGGRRSGISTSRPDLPARLGAAGGPIMDSLSPTIAPGGGLTPFRSGPPEVTLVQAFARPLDNAVATARTCYSSKGIVTVADVAGDSLSAE